VADTYFAYFIGGSRDLSKMAIEGQPREIPVPVFSAGAYRIMETCPPGDFPPDIPISATVETYILVDCLPFDPRVLIYALKPEKYYGRPSRVHRN
jgi:hypothetical protein